LMNKLGYKKYWAQGGDWGSIIGSFIAIHDSENVIGLHTNMPVSQILPYNKGIVGFFKSVATLLFPSFMLDSVEYEEWKKFSFTQLLEETGYMHLQATKPYSVAVALSDSPVGLLTYITEKFYAWSEHNNHQFGNHCPASSSSSTSSDSSSTSSDSSSTSSGSSTSSDSSSYPPCCISKDEIITNVMMYYLPNHIGPSIRFYYEYFHSDTPRDRSDIPYVTVPTAVAVFLKEIQGLRIKSSIAYSYNIFRFTRFPAGGHFAALEQPKVLVEDIRNFRRDLSRENLRKTNSDL